MFDSICTSFTISLPSSLTLTLSLAHSLLSSIPLSFFRNNSRTCWFSCKIHRSFKIMLIISSCWLESDKCQAEIEQCSCSMPRFIAAMSSFFQLFPLSLSHSLRRNLLAVCGFTKNSSHIPVTPIIWTISHPSCYQTNHRQFLGWKKVVPRMSAKKIIKLYAQHDSHDLFHIPRQY